VILLLTETGIEGIKAMTIHSKLTLVGRCFVGAIVAVLALSCTADAVQAGGTPNASVINFSLAPGASTGILTPPANMPVQVMGTCLTDGYRGVGSATLVRNPGAFIMWTGINSTPNGSVTHGFSNTPGTWILQIDYIGHVWIEVASTGDTVRIHNYAPGIRTGTTTWFW
jgi:hypothetical protein